MLSRWWPCLEERDPPELPPYALYWAHRRSLRMCTMVVMSRLG